MLPGLVIRGPDCDHSLLSLIDGDFDNQCKVASNLGYKGVAIIALYPERVDGNYILDTLNRYNLQPVEIITGELANQRQLTVWNIPDIVRNGLLYLAKQLDTHICLGKFIGKHNLNEICTFINCCDKVGVRTTIEPIPATSMPNCQIAKQFIDNYDLANTGITLDTCHANNTGNIMAEIFVAGDKLEHVHIADSNREYPGSGNIKFKIVREALKMVKYNGYCSLEIYPKPNAEVALQFGTDKLMGFVP